MWCLNQAPQTIQSSPGLPASSPRWALPSDTHLYPFTHHTHSSCTLHTCRLPMSYYIYTHAYSHMHTHWAPSALETVVLGNSLCQWDGLGLGQCREHIQPAEGATALLALHLPDLSYPE